MNSEAVYRAAYRFADSFGDTAAAYVHIPFCATICPYCDFAVVEGQDDLARRYVDAVVAEIDSSDSWRPLEAIYFGGGTPSHVDPTLLDMILKALDDRHGIASDAEISLEANPEDFTSERAELLKRMGFNRVSFGAQSFDSAVLVSLGRRHRGDHIAFSVQAARRAGFDNISLDLIYGTPGERKRSWALTMTQAIGLMPDHVSCYALTVERGTPLGRAVNEGSPAPDPDVQADRYEYADTTLSESGFERYEVSNWSRPGFECRYNMTVWAQGEYEAYGNGAHGYRHGRRFRNIRRLEAYINSIEDSHSARAGEDVIEGWDAELDRLFVGLRRTAGVTAGEGTMALLDSDDGRRLIEAGVISMDQDRLRIVKPLLTDAVHRSAMALQRPIVSGETNA
jgi:oxygen-independent coproporphyrinogen-3 oxidase